MAKTKGFDSAYQELQAIVEELQDENISIDQLSDKIKKAKVLLSTAKDKLRNVELDIKSIISDE